MPESAYLPVVDTVTDYEKIERIGEGTFGIVCTSLTINHQAQTLSNLTINNHTDKAKECSTGDIVALKKARLDKERDGTTQPMLCPNTNTCCMPTSSKPHTHRTSIRIHPTYASNPHTHPPHICIHPTYASTPQACLSHSSVS